ncbi:hypothetical protein Dgeo_3062 (plasmid) [Deinococcus geothermalis DSM 11300]|uniref:Uncharacterized protein n=1 Tax=Deinococcus geothermalis (strain DSM 11300 / CIP 105573 / AG-3a) TaxID=319795 RepID=A8ZRJ4_DEIGD|nr:hypothetical protein [Deinococcus geothermalis]ABW35103.1 hypothetical protein Dgeo_3062 [Deinococcus geothermalis DSM 11300]
MSDAQAIHSVLLRASRAAGQLAAHLRAHGIPVRVALHPDGVALYVPEDDVIDADPAEPAWKAITGLPVHIYS